MSQISHERDAPEPEHEWVKIYRNDLLVHVYCEVCDVTPLEWLNLQPIQMNSVVERVGRRTRKP